MEDKLFTLFNEAHLGNFKIINMALRDKNISMDNLVRYKSMVKRMRASMRQLGKLYQREENERYRALCERVMKLDYALNARMREKF
nr:MAG TPA: hypothetical protein [Caudoviricetes sp.]